MCGSKKKDYWVTTCFVVVMVLMIQLLYFGEKHKELSTHGFDIVVTMHGVVILVNMPH